MVRDWKGMSYVKYVGRENSGVLNLYWARDSENPNLPRIEAIMD
jgi:hypothetical protein